MGGGGHHVNRRVQTQVVQRGPTDEQVKAQIQQQQQNQRRAAEDVQRKQREHQEHLARLKRQEEERKRIQKENFARAEKLEFQNYLARLKGSNITAAIPMVGKGEKHYAVIGPIASGKSTFLNSIFTLNEDTGIGETTDIAKPVYKNEVKKLIVWDVPGINKNFSIYKSQNLAFFAGCHKIFILYKDSPKRCDKIISVLNAIKPGQLILVRTQCDNWDATQNKTLEQERQTDKDILSQWKIPIKGLYQHSSYKYGFDNNAIKAEIMN